MMADSPRSFKQMQTVAVAADRVAQAARMYYPGTIDASTFWDALDTLDASVEELAYVMKEEGQDAPLGR